jgi:hypothetical protein
MGDNDVLILAFPAHTTNIVHALDFVFCGAVKTLMAAAEGELRDNSVSDEITRLVRACRQTAMSIMVRGAFPKAGLVPDTSVRSLRLTTEDDKISEHKGF